MGAESLSSKPSLDNPPTGQENIDQLHDPLLDIDSSDTSFKTPQGNQFYAVGSDRAACVLLTQQAKLNEGIPLEGASQTAVQQGHADETHWHKVQVGADPIPGPSFTQRMGAFMQEKFRLPRAGEVKPLSPLE